MAETRVTDGARTRDSWSHKAARESDSSKNSDTNEVTTDAKSCPKIAVGDSHSVPGTDIPRVLRLRRETLRIFATGVGPDEVAS
jgi:hypothetical protein